MPSLPFLSPVREHTPSQHRLRRRISALPLRRGVRLAARVVFGFTHRAQGGEALWSDREGVWLGRTTFLHWALHDAAIDIPWLVMDTNGAPQVIEDLHNTVRKELLIFWTKRVASLPCKSTPAWLPLP